MRPSIRFLLLIGCVGGCDALDTNRTVQPHGSFGEVVYRESCQRVAYIGQIDQKAAGQINTIDVSGQLGRSVCVDGNAPPANAPPKLPALVAEKAELVSIVDTVAPKDFLDQLEHFLEEILPLADEGTIEHAVASVGDLLGTMAKDPAFPTALAHLAVRNGYRPTKIATGLVQALINYPHLDECKPGDAACNDFMGTTLKVIAQGGSGEVEWKSLLTALAMELSTVVPVADPGAPDRTLKLALNLLTSTNVELGVGTPRPLVQRDYRGLAVAASDAGGNLVAPFVDLNHDGLADADAMGHYVDAKGTPLKVPTPFAELGVTDTAPRDLEGRALTAQSASTTLYNYYDLDGTVFGALAREGLALMDPTKDTTLGLVWGAAALLGPRKSQTKIYMDPMGGMQGALTYNGFDTSQSSMLDLLHAFVQILGDPNGDATLQSVSTLLTQYESPTARVVAGMLDAVDRGKLHAEAQVPMTSTLYDDLVPFINRILLVPGLAQDLMDALQDPRVADFAPMIARLMAANNQIDFNHQGGPNYDLIGGPGALDAISPVDRKQFDVDYNRSLMQRIAHLIHDLNGVQFCNKEGAQFSVVVTFGPYAKCKLFQIDDLALFFALNMASSNGRNANPSGSAEAGANFCSHITDSTVRNLPGLDALLPNQTGISGFNCHPTPKAQARSLFLRQNEKSSFMAGTTDDILCADADKAIDVHDKSIFAWETRLANAPSGNNNATFYDAVQPIMDAFAKHDECVAHDSTGACTKTQNAAKIFVDIFSMLHTHWTSPKGSYFGHTYQAANPTATRFSYPDNVVSYEPLMVEVLGQADLMPAILGLAPTLNTATVDGKTGSPSVRDAILASAKYIFTPGASKGLTKRDGVTTTTTKSDGSGTIPLTPYYLLADAYAHKRVALAAGDQNQASAWKTATSALVDQLLTVKKNVNGTWQFANRRFHGITTNALAFTRARIAAHNKANDLATWVHQTLPQNLTDTLSGPVFAAAGDFVAKIEADSNARTQLYMLLQYLVDEADHDLVFQTALTTLADQAQSFLDDPDFVPVAHVAGAAVDPKAGTVDAAVTMMKRTHDVDAEKTLHTLLTNLYKQGANGLFPASRLGDVLAELNRASPGQGGPLSGADYKSILNEVKSFFIDDQRGYTRFVQIVKHRNAE